MWHSIFWEMRAALGDLRHLEGFLGMVAREREDCDPDTAHRAGLGRPLPLAWRRGRVRAVLMSGETVELPGYISPPFGTFRGDNLGLSYVGSFKQTLVYLPAARIVATFRYARDCKALASELARLWVRWGGNEPTEDPGPVIDRHRRDSL